MLYDAATDKVVTATIGELRSGEKTGPAVKTIKLLAQSTGEFTRDELKKDARLSWTDKARAEIAAAKGAASPASQGGENSGSTGGNGGGNTGENGGTGGNTGGNNGGGGGDPDPGDDQD